MHAQNHNDVTLMSLAHVEDIAKFGTGLCALFSLEAAVGGDSCLQVIIMTAEPRIDKFCETFTLLKVAYDESAIGTSVVQQQFYCQHCTATEATVASPRLLP